MVDIDRKFYKGGGNQQGCLLASSHLYCNVCIIITGDFFVGLCSPLIVNYGKKIEAND